MSRRDDKPLARFFMVLLGRILCREWGAEVRMRVPLGAQPGLGSHVLSAEARAIPLSLTEGEEAYTLPGSNRVTRGKRKNN